MPDRVNAGVLDHADPGAPSAAARALSVLAPGATSAIATVLMGGGQGCWLALPAALAAAAFCQTTAVALVAAAAALLGGVLPAVALSSLARPASPLLGLVIAATSIAVVLALRRRTEVERRGLRASALSDPLTGAANRRALVERVNYEVARHARLGHGFALLALDLDGFKSLNDRFGHGAGDELLRDVVLALRHAVREQDTVARTGGDEFWVLAPETDAAGAQRLVARIELAVTNVTAGLEALSTSVGLARFPTDGDTAASMLEAADNRLLAHKRRRPRRDERSRRAA